MSELHGKTSQKHAFFSSKTGLTQKEKKKLMETCRKKMKTEKKNRGPKNWPIPQGMKKGDAILLKCWMEFMEGKENCRFVEEALNSHRGS